MTGQRVVLIDDQVSVREGLGEMLRVFGYEVDLYESADSFLETADSSALGCVVADVRMPGMDGIELVRVLARRRSGLQVVLMSGHADVPMAVAAIKAGAEEFIEKPIDDAQLVSAINRCLARNFEQRGQQQSAVELRAQFERLTPREIEVFDLVTQGCTSPAIAARLKISTRTVESYRVQIMEKMRAESVAVLVRQAIRLGRMTP
jgi:two-component system, LuxR family, response regulator FixJ